MNEKLNGLSNRLCVANDCGQWSASYSGYGTSCYQGLKSEDGSMVALAVAHDAEPFGDPDTRENARRLAACWNALEGVPTEHLESLIGAVMAKGGFVGLWSNYCDLKDQRSDLLETLNMATDALAGGLWDYGPGQDEHEKCNEVIAQCRAVLAKALKS